MTDRIRRAFKMPRREPEECEASNEFVNEMRDVRCTAIGKSRETVQSILRLERILASGDLDYNELNHALFGRDGWPRQEGKNP